VTLRELLARDSALEPAIIAEWFDAVICGVEAAHATGIVHRDLKPENVLVSHSSGAAARVKVLDFGLAKIRDDRRTSTPSLTEPGTIMGTFGYIAPEQFTGDTVDERADVFSIGVMAIEALTGRRPFLGRTLPEYLHSLLHVTYHLPGEGPEVEALDAVLQRCIAREIGARFPSVLAMREALIPAMRRCPRLRSDAINPLRAETTVVLDTGSALGAVDRQTVASEDS
jgi:serine/threonine-protein kinase